MKRHHRYLLALACLMLLAAAALLAALRPERVARLVLARTGTALGLEITATGRAGYRLLGTPRLVLRGVVAREPGAATAILRAERIAIAVPWSTLRSRGAVLDMQRVELDAPELGLEALRAWLAKRPPAATRIPALREGLSVVRGRVAGQGWDLSGLAITVPELRPDAPVAAHVRGRFRAAPLGIGFDLYLAATRPADGTGAAAVGRLDAAGEGWTLPARVRLSAPLRFEAGSLRLAPAHLAVAARYATGAGAHPFALGLHGPVRLGADGVALAPVALALRGDGLLPRLDARGAIALDERLVLRLQGSLASWNAAWPALPPPLGTSTAPLPFRLDYAGPMDASGVAHLELRRDQARFEGRFRLPRLLHWIDAAHAGTPLPPLAGRLLAPRMEIPGARLEGVEVEIDDPSPGDGP